MEGAVNSQLAAVNSLSGGNAYGFDDPGYGELGKPRYTLVVSIHQACIMTMVWRYREAVSGLRESWWRRPDETAPRV